jgi:hypothetical protein
MGIGSARSARALAVAVLLLPAAARAAGDPPPRLALADFEDPACLEGIHAGNGAAERLAEEPPGSGHALRWTLEAADSSYLYLPLPAPTDLAGYGALSLRIRCEGERPGALWVRLENASRAHLGARLRGAGSSWRTFVLDLAGMERSEDFDPAQVVRVDLVVFGAREGAYRIDDLVLLPAAAAPPPDAAAKGPSRKPVRVPVADFEEPGSEESVDAFRSEVERVPAGGRGKGSVLRWTVAGGGRSAFLALHGLPRDVRPFRALRFRIRADRPVAADLHVRLETTVDDLVGGRISGIGKEWRTEEILLPDLRRMGNFDPAWVRNASFIFFDPVDAVIQIDDVELETGSGGWQYTETEMVAHAFGKDRARKVRKIATEHFDVYTDSAAATSKFPRALEETYGFVKSLLGTPEMEEKLPVYIFQSPTLYAEFCVRFTGWTKEQAEKTAGHGSGLYFATYYQAPEAPTVTHELTHSIFHRTSGYGGGSWFQEGVAVYVEYAWQKKSAAAEFAPSLRGDRFVRLAEFLAIPTLVAVEDAKGGPLTADRLYLQAGAFYEFLVRGPFADRAPSLVRALARTDRAEGESAAVLAKVLGKDLAAVEKEWIAWGGDPPKRK